MAEETGFEKRQPVGASSVNVLLVVVLIVLTVLLAWQTWFRVGPNGSAGGTYQPRDITPTGKLTSEELRTIAVFKEASPSVVFIRTKGVQQFLFREQEKELSSGTGFVWDRKGHIVTNLHVVRDALLTPDSDLEVQFADKTVVDAEVIGGVHEFDIAILRITDELDRLTPITLGTSDDLQVGQNVLAIGSPFGFDQTLSTGVIGGLNRSVATEEGNPEDGSGILAGLIQTDAAINPGNSGGPLLDSSGRMIGVNTAIVSPTGAYSGLGFAVPVSNVVASVEMVLQESTSNQKPILGVTILSPEQAEILGVPEEISSRGLFIKQIEPGGPASRTGLRATQQQGYRIYLGDQIAAIDETPIRTLDELQKALAAYKPGDVVAVKIFRGNQSGEIAVTLQARKLLFW